MPRSRSARRLAFAAALGLAVPGAAHAQVCFNNETDPNVCSRPEQQVVLQFRNNCQSRQSVGLCVTNPQGSINGYSGSAEYDDVVRFSIGRCEGAYRYGWRDGGVPPPPC